MARKVTAMVASALLLALVLVSYGKHEIIKKNTLLFLFYIYEFSLILTLKRSFIHRADAGVDSWCLEYPAPDINACRRNGSGVQPCANQCRAAGQGFRGGACKDNGDCVCLKCAEELPAAAAANT
jgi:hypothetical protein